MPVFLKFDGIDGNDLPPPPPPPPPPPSANGGGRDGKGSDLSADPVGRADGGGTGKTLSANLLGKPAPIGGEADAHASDAFFYGQATDRLDHTSPDDGASFVMNDMIPAEPAEQFDLMGSEPDLGVLPLEQMALNFTRVDWD